MRVKIAIAASVILLATANSRAEDNKACILKATATVPRISGLVIKKTRTRPVPAAILATWQGQTRPIIVDDWATTENPVQTDLIVIVPHPRSGTPQS